MDGKSVNFISFPLLCFRFNLSFEESLDDIDGSDEGRDEAGKPCFAGSGFTRKEEEDIQRVNSVFIVRLEGEENIGIIFLKAT